MAPLLLLAVELPMVPWKVRHRAHDPIDFFGDVVGVWSLPRRPTQNPDLANVRVELKHLMYYALRAGRILTWALGLCLRWAFKF